MHTHSHSAASRRAKQLQQHNTDREACIAGGSSGRRRDTQALSVGVVAVVGAVDVVDGWPREWLRTVSECVLAIARAGWRGETLAACGCEFSGC